MQLSQGRHFKRTPANSGKTLNASSTTFKRHLQYALIAFLAWTSSTPALAETTTQALKSGEKMLAQVQNNITNIDTDTLEQALAKDPDMLLIDVRTRREINLTGGYINAHQNINIPRGWLEMRINEIAPKKDTPIIVYCGTNQRSPFAAKTLSEMGYTNVKNYANGFVDWKQSNKPVYAYDLYPGSMLFREPEEVIEGVWTSIGATAPGMYENTGHNNNLSFIITDEGVVVVNAGGTYLLAEALHEEIKKRTDKPVKYVVLENGQGHAMLGSSYWKSQGATIIAHKDAAHEMEERGERILARVKARYREKAFKTTLTMPDKLFEDKLDLSMGGVKIEALQVGPSHSPGDISVWLPEKKLIITGDLAFHQRLLPIFEDTQTADWVETWGEFEAMGAKYVIPGHGDPTDMKQVTQYTKGYLTYMREKINEVIENGGGMNEAYEIDQSAYKHLHTFRELNRLNVNRLFQMMEFE